MNKLSLLVLLFILPFFTAGAFADGISITPNEKISPYVIHQFSKKAKGEILVLMAKEADLSGAGALQDKPREQRIGFVYKTLVDHANATQTKLLTYLKSKKVKVQRFFISNMVLVKNATPQMVNEIAAMDDVKHIAGNPAVKQKMPKTRLTGSDAVRSVGANLVSIGADRVWNELGVLGENIVVAGQDTGVQWDHPALKNSYRGNTSSGISHDYNWHDSIHEPFKTDSLGKKDNKCGYNLKAPCDDDQHGTHTMGTMVGNDGAENAVGVAPHAKWIACRNMDSGNGKPSSYIECFQYFLAPTKIGGDMFRTGDPAKAPHVINNSWGCPVEEGCSGDEILPALKAMKAAGIMVVASAGNDGPDCSTIKDPPAYHTGVTLTVGAYNHRDGKIASFSSRGPSTFDGGAGPTVSAPGVSIRSSIPGGDYDGGMWSGTSMAGPHVVGQVALMWSANPKLIGDIDGTIALIQATAESVKAAKACGGEVSGSTPNNTYGSGRIRVYQSVKAALN